MFRSSTYCTGVRLSVCHVIINAYDDDDDYYYYYYYYYIIAQCRIISKQNIMNLRGLTGHRQCHIHHWTLLGGPTKMKPTYIFVCKILIEYEWIDKIQWFLVNAITIHSHTLGSIKIWYCSSDGATKARFFALVTCLILLQDGLLLAARLLGLFLSPSLK